MPGTHPIEMKRLFNKIRNRALRVLPWSRGRWLHAPDYACVGFPKCATTFILKQFSEYSFDTLIDGEIHIKNLDGYRPKIAEIHKTGGRVAIKNPSIIYSKSQIKYLLKSNCKLIVSVRNPVRWIKSYYNYRLKRIDSGKESCPKDFKQIPSFRQIIEDDLKFMGVSLSRGKMANIISCNLLSCDYFERSNVHFVIQEEFESNHDKVQGDLLDFLGIPKESRLERSYHFEYQKPERWSKFNSDEHDEFLYRYYAEDMRALCTLIKEQTGKDLRAIWEVFYSIKLD